MSGFLLFIVILLLCRRQRGAVDWTTDCDHDNKNARGLLVMLVVVAGGALLYFFADPHIAVALLCVVAFFCALLCLSPLWRGIKSRRWTPTQTINS